MVAVGSVAAAWVEAATRAAVATAVAMVATSGVMAVKEAAASGVMAVNEAAVLAVMAVMALPGASRPCRWSTSSLAWQLRSCTRSSY